MSTPVVEMWVEYVRMKDLLIHKTKYAHKKNDCQLDESTRLVALFEYILIVRGVTKFILIEVSLSCNAGPLSLPPPPPEPRVESIPQVTIVGLQLNWKFSVFCEQQDSQAAQALIF